MGDWRKYFGYDSLTHPDAPDGGTGRGRARIPPSGSSSYVASSSVPHPNSPAARSFDWSSLPGLDLIERVSDVSDAIDAAKAAAGDAILEETGEELGEILEGIIPGLLLCLCVVAATTALGASAGAAIGALALGVGAIPSAAVGAGLGLEAGLYVLSYVGLGFLIGTIGVHLYNALQIAAQGVEEAWYAVDTPTTRRFRVQHAGKTLARALGVYMRGVLQAIVALLLAGGAYAAAQKAPALIARVRQSRFGEGFASWLERNWTRLIANERFQPAKDPDAIGTGKSDGGGSGSGGGGGGSSKPSVPPRKPEVEPEPKPAPKAGPATKPEPKPAPPEAEPKPSANPEAQPKPAPKRTQPSGTVDPNAKPRGTRTKIPDDADPGTRRALERENDTADIMVKRGYDVEQNPDVPGPKEPDYKIEGEVFDCYSPEPDTSPRNVASGVGKKIKKQQTERVVVNLQDWQGDVGTLDKQMSDWPIEGLKEMMVVDKSGNILHIFP